MKLWKIKRELRRMWQHALMVPEAVFGPGQRRRYDRRKADLIRLSAGAQPMQANMAIFLLYQPRGLLPSTLETCRHLARHGFAVVAVSNAPLSDEDRARLLAETHQVMERPNFGYDFGGYRDGVLHVLDCGFQPETLLVLNDSIWFPLRPDCDFLDGVKTQGADVYGAVMSHDHLQSYFYAFKRGLVLSPFFRDLWQNLPTSDNKVAVVLRCEKLLSGHIQRAGYTMGWFRSNADCVEAIGRLPDAELAEVIRYDQKNDNSLGRAFRGFRPEGPGWREAALALCARTRGVRYLLKDHPMILVRELDLPLLKKDRAPQYALQRRTLIESPLFAGLVPAVASEIRRWDSK